MLAKKYRLTTSFFRGRTSEKKIFPKLLQTNEFSVKIFSSPLPHGRFAVVASLSVFKKTSERNKYRRLIYEAIRKSGIEKKPGMDVVIYLKPGIKKFSGKEIEELIGKLPIK